MTNTNKLKGRIVEMGYNLGSFSCAMGLSVKSFRDKLNNRNDFKASEIKLMCSLLNIDPVNVSAYFFA